MARDKTIARISGIGTVLILFLHKGPGNKFLLKKSRTMNWFPAARISHSGWAATM